MENLSKLDIENHSCQILPFRDFPKFIENPVPELPSTMWLPNDLENTEWNEIMKESRFHKIVLDLIRHDAQNIVDPKFQAMICGVAAKHGRVKVLQWLFSKRYAYKYDISEVAAEFGRLNVLKWLKQENITCNWNPPLCEKATKNGHLSVLKWLNDQESIWSEKCMKIATSNNHKEIVYWILTSGLPFEREPVLYTQSIWKKRNFFIENE